MGEEFEDTAVSDNNKLSKINSAGLVNSALHNLWLDFFRHYRQGKYLSANSDLDCVWTILGGEEGMEESDNEKKYRTAEKNLSETGTLQDSLTIKGFSSKPDDKQITKMTKQKQRLLEKALFLRKLQNVQGMGKAYYDPDDHDID